MNQGVHFWLSNKENYCILYMVLEGRKECTIKNKVIFLASGTKEPVTLDESCNGMLPRVYVQEWCHGAPKHFSHRCAFCLQYCWYAISLNIHNNTSRLLRTQWKTLKAWITTYYINFHNVQKNDELLTNPQRWSLGFEAKDLCWYWSWF